MDLYSTPMLLIGIGEKMLTGQQIKAVSPIQKEGKFYANTIAIEVYQGQQSW